MTTPPAAAPCACTAGTWCSLCDAQRAAIAAPTRCPNCGGCVERNEKLAAHRDEWGKSFVGGWVCVAPDDWCGWARTDDGDVREPVGGPEGGFPTVGNHCW